MMSNGRKPLPSEIARATKNLKSLDLPTIKISRHSKNGKAGLVKGEAAYNVDSLERVVSSFDQLQGKLVKSTA